MEEQSPFVNDQESLQPPPELIKPPVSVPKEKRRRPWFLIAVIGLLIMVMLDLLAAVIQQQKVEVAPMMPTPTYSPPPTSSPKESALQKLKVMVDEADPDSNPFPPPQVDMDVSF